MNEVAYINDQERNTYYSVIKDFNEVVLKDFQYKLTNKILVTKSFLHRIRKNEDNLCLIVSREQKQFYIYLSIVIKLKNFGNLYKCGCYKI